MKELNNVSSVSWNHHGVTILWAPRSPCNLNCQYCYFGTAEEHLNFKTPLRSGELGHIGNSDVTLDVIMEFISSFTSDLVHRVFIAGGEPLNWSGIRPVVAALREKNIEVVICTNGLSLSGERMSSWLIESKVDAVSVSLDSHDQEYNDFWRKDRSGRGWKWIVKGIKMLIQKKNELGSLTKVGVYSVVTRLNIDHILQTALFVSELGIDYFIIQPVSLAKEHELYGKLSLDSSHYVALSNALDLLMKSGIKIQLPNNLYLKLMLSTLVDEGKHILVQNCFGGRDLFFIEPDGSLWDCPSMYKIAETPSERLLSIKRKNAAEIFSSVRQLRNTDCTCFSGDCVNMWQLMVFDEIIDS